MSWKWFGFVTAGVLGAISVTGCRGTQAGSEAKPFPMGAQVNVGKLVYMVVDSQWRDVLESPDGALAPKHRYLLLNITVTNNGDEESGVPLLHLVDSAGTETIEESKGDGVPQWLGYLRILRPGETKSGYILFDVVPGNHRLRVGTGGDPEKEVTASIEIPYRIEAPTRGVDPMANPAPAK
jgi:hypothetical protein